MSENKELKLNLPPSGCIRVLSNDSEAEFEESGDFILPDSLPDIRKTVSVNAALASDGVFVRDGVIECDGEIVFDYLYIADDDTLRHAEFSIEYDRKINRGGLDADSVYDIAVFAGGVNAKIQNPRKVNLKANLEVTPVVWDNLCISPSITGERTLDDDMRLQRFEEKTMSVSVANATDEFSISEELETDTSMPEIAEILAARITPVSGECRAGENSVSVRGDVYVKCLCMSEDGRPFSVDKRIPFSHTFDADGITPDRVCECRLAVVQKSVAVGENGYGERRIISFDILMRVTVNCMKNEETVLTRDMYSYDWKYSNQYVPVALTGFEDTLSTNFTDTMNSAREEGDGDGTDIVFCDYTVDNPMLESDGEKSRLYLTADAHAVMLVYTPGEGEKYSVKSIEKKIRFQFPGSHPENTICMYRVYPITVKGRADASGFTAEVETGVCASVYRQSEEKIITSIALDTSEQNSPCRSSMTFCYPNGKDSLWKIAKDNGVSLDELKSENGVSDDTLNAKKVLVIPKKKQKPIYSKLIT